MKKSTFWVIVFFVIMALVAAKVTNAQEEYQTNEVWIPYMSANSTEICTVKGSTDVVIIKHIKMDNAVNELVKEIKARENNQEIILGGKTYMTVLYEDHIYTLKNKAGEVEMTSTRVADIRNRVRDKILGKA